MIEKQRVSMPGRLVGVLVVLVVQAIGNGFLGWVIVDELNEDAEHGATMEGAGFFYFLGYLSIALAVLALVCVVFTVWPRAWVRPVVITIEGVAVVSGLVNLVNGAIAGLVGIVIAAALITVMLNQDVVEWYRR